MIITATGHRPSKLGGYGGAVEKHLLELAEAGIKRYPEATHIVSGMALGWDQAIAQAAINLKISLVAAVPFAGQELPWPSSSRFKYRQLLEQAESVVIVCDGGFAGWKLQKRNEYMVDNADLVLALYDGSTGGTCNCISYANKVGKPVVNLWPEYQCKQPSSC